MTKLLNPLPVLAPVGTLRSLLQSVKPIADL
jgi:hypothetical protein